MSRNPRLKLSLPPPAASGRERSDDIEEREEERWTWKVSAPEKKEEKEEEKEEEETDEESEEEEECDVTRVYTAKRAGGCDHEKQSGHRLPPSPPDETTSRSRYGAEWDRGGTPF